MILNNNELPDVVILDMQMPESNGISIAKAIKGLKPKLPIIPLSYIGNDDIPKHHELFSPVLTKPVKQAQLFKLVQNELITEVDEKGAPEASKHPSILSKDFATNYPLSILIAEDNLINQKLATVILSKLGYKPEVANDGEQAVKMFKAKLYDVILMDMQMPVMDGIEATQTIRSNLQLKQPQIIAMTANASAEDREKCLKAGMNDYISKPVKLDELMNLLKNAAMKVQLLS